MKELWSPMLKTWFPKGVDDPKISLICIDLESAQIWDTPLNKMNLVLSMAKAFKKGEAMNPEGNSQKIDLHH
jgi:general stress protein 26